MIGLGLARPARWRGSHHRCLTAGGSERRPERGESTRRYYGSGAIAGRLELSIQTDVHQAPEIGESLVSEQEVGIDSSEFNYADFHE